MSETQLKKPAKVEVGQRWKGCMSTGTVAAVFDGEACSDVSHDGNHVHWVEPSMFGDDIAWDYTRTVIDCMAFLAHAPSYSVPREPVGVRAGQRRRDKDGRGDYTVEDHPSKRGEFQLRWDDGACVGIAFTAAELAGDPLLPDTPSTTPAVPAAKEAGKSCHRCGKKHNERLGLCAPCDAALEAECSPPNPQKRDLREVSHNGKPGSWVNYDSLDDSDEFRSYKFRRVNGFEVPQLGEVPASIRCVGYYAGPEGELCSWGGTVLGATPRSEFIRAPKPLPWSPSVDDVDLLPDVGR